MTIEQLETKLVEGSAWTKGQRIIALRLAYLGHKSPDDATKEEISAYHALLTRQLNQSDEIKARESSRRWNERHK